MSLGGHQARCSGCRTSADAHRHRAHVFPISRLRSSPRMRGATLATDTEVEEVLVLGRQTERYRETESSLSKLTEDLLDTPQSVTTMSSELLEDRGITSINDALRTIPGITLGAGEFSWQGNNPTIRGFSGRDDMYLGRYTGLRQLPARSI